MLRRSFTLIEVIVVLVIILVVTGIVVSQFRADSPVMVLNTASDNLQSWLSRIRYMAAEKGRDYVIKYEYGGQVLSAAPDYSEAELEKIRIDNEVEIERHEWKVPEKCKMSTEDGAEEELSDGTALEVFRFYSDGGAGVARRLVLRCDKLVRSFDISFFNGRLIVTESDAAVEYKDSGRDRSTEPEAEITTVSQ